MAKGSNAVASQPAGSKQVSRAQQAGEVEEYEHNASASASAGLNLNIFGAISGAFAGRKKTERSEGADGKSIEHTTEEGVGHARGVGAGNLSVQGNAAAQESQKGRKAVASGQQDHLGIEG